MRIAFLGTPDFALPSLKMLIKEGHTLHVFTQPDKPVGRKAVMTPPPVKKLALEHGIPVFQCEKIRMEEGCEALRDFAPDLMVTAAFGQILSAENLSIPKCGCINVHGSILPKYRGAAPIQWAVINGEKETGVTTMMTDAGLDTGDILLVKKTPIGENETAGELFDRLAELGAELLKETIEALEAGMLVRTPQNEAEATKCGMLKKEDGHVDFDRGMQYVHDRVRGMNPWPGAFAYCDGEVIKLWKTKKTDLPSTSVPGKCIAADPKKGLFVDAGDGVIEILELQFPGAKRMDAKTALRGHDLSGKVLQ
ncbi:MAG: methionyl-tRNA formyltransferase [Clostridiales bacterium]|nr:methionyl-tRNA formyltransferase [Clostridiales bacterium]